MRTSHFFPVDWGTKGIAFLMPQTHLRLGVEPGFTPHRPSNTSMGVAPFTWCNGTKNHSSTVQKHTATVCRGQAWSTLAHDCSCVRHLLRPCAWQSIARCVVSFSSSSLATRPQIDSRSLTQWLGEVRLLIPWFSLLDWATVSDVHPTCHFSARVHHGSGDTVLVTFLSHRSELVTWNLVRSRFTLVLLTVNHVWRQSRLTSVTFHVRRVPMSVLIRVSSECLSLSTRWSSPFWQVEHQLIRISQKFVLGEVPCPHTHATVHVYWPGRSGMVTPGTSLYSSCRHACNRNATCTFLVPLPHASDKNQGRCPQNQGRRTFSRTVQVRALEKHKSPWKLHWVGVAHTRKAN